MSRAIAMLPILVLTSAIQAATAEAEPVSAPSPDGDDTAYALLGGAEALRGASENATYRLAGLVREALEVEPIFADGFESGDLTAWSPPDGMPTGTVAFFDLVACPPGWGALPEASGRALVALPAGGTAGGVTGVPVSDLAAPSHSHVVAQSKISAYLGAHYHEWAWLDGAASWYSFDASSVVVTLYTWGNGMGSEGSGYYPFSADLGAIFSTSTDGDHAHQVALNHATGTAGASAVLPYLQLLVCRKI